MRNITYKIKGNTYNYRDIFKHEYHATWDIDSRSWVIIGRLTNKTLQDIRSLSNKIWIEIS